MRTLAALIPLLAASLASAAPKYFDIFVDDAKVGFASTESRPDTCAGQPAVRTETHFSMTLLFAGTKLKRTFDTTFWVDSSGRLLKQSVTTTGGGRKSKVDVTFGPQTISLEGELEGKKLHESAPLPDGTLALPDLILFQGAAKLIHDQATAQGGAPSGQTIMFWALGPEGPIFGQTGQIGMTKLTQVEVDGKKVAALVTEMKSGSIPAVKLFTSPEGDLLREEFAGAEKLVIQSATKDQALSDLGKNLPDVDLLNSLKVEGNLGQIDRLTELKLRIVGEDLSSIPSDDFQTVTKDGDGWTVDIHPKPLRVGAGIPLSEIGKGQAVWLNPSPKITSDDPTLRDIARKLVTENPSFTQAVRAIRMYVAEKMKYEVGLGAPRDASEILRKPKGKCTDYAILTVALLRAAGIPARMVGGLVLEDQSFGYHAWCEVWDGEKWVGVDSTANIEQLPAAYIKLAQGTVEESFNLPNPPDASAVKIKVLKASF